MNEHLTTSENGVALITAFEGAPRLKARLCEGGAWELSWGVTFHPDGTPVQEGEEITYEYAVIMFRHALRVFEEAVQRLVTVELSQNQFDSLTSFAYNVGEANLASSTVLREVNNRLFDDAAEAFGMWLYATRNGYKRALRGLLRRRYAEACVFLGYDWEEACADECVALSSQKPAKLPGRDTVLYKTPFANVLAIARNHPLTAMPDEILEDPEPVHREAGEREPEPIVASSPPPKIPAVATPPYNPVGTKPLSPNTLPTNQPAEYGTDPAKGSKPLEESTRYKGQRDLDVGSGIMRFAGLGGLGSWPQALVAYVNQDPILAAMIAAGISFAAIQAGGFLYAKWGEWRRERGRKDAVQLLR